MYNNAHHLDLEVADLLVCSGFVMPHELDKALACKRDTGSRLRDVLMVNYNLEESIWDAGHSVVEQINQKRLPASQARTALYMIGNCRMSVSEALTKMGYLSSNTNPWHKQLNMLAESGKWEIAN